MSGDLGAAIEAADYGPYVGDSPLGPDEVYCCRCHLAAIAHVTGDFAWDTCPDDARCRRCGHTLWDHHEDGMGEPMTTCAVVIGDRACPCRRFRFGAAS